MRTEQEIREQIEKVRAVANGDPGLDRDLARNISHLLIWVLGETDYMPPSEMFGWVTTSLPELAEALNKMDPREPLEGRLVRFFRDKGALPPELGPEDRGLPAGLGGVGSARPAGGSVLFSTVKGE